MQAALTSSYTNCKVSDIRVSRLSNPLQPIAHHSHSRRRFSIASQIVVKASGKPDLTPTSSVVTDNAVPEGHKGLHSLLYGEGGAEEAHGTAAPAAANRAPYTFHEGEDDGTAIVSAESYLESREGERPVGVFAVYDSRRNLQYVGYSRNMVLSIRTILTRVNEDRCAFVRVMVFANKAMQSRAALQREADNWLAEAGTLPPGNGSEQDLWNGSSTTDTSTTFDLSSMSADELAAYEEKKDKMKRAMGEIKKEQGDEKEDTMDERQAKMRAAMNNGDWSAVIDGQTSETTNNGDTTTNTATNPNANGPIVTPFARASVHRSIGNTTQASLSASETTTKSSNGSSSSANVVEMTVETVDKVLDDVRPYLIADGGNVDVVSVKNGIVALQLQGACGTCASSSATMKMGIERALRGAFGDQVKEVISIGGAVDTSATVENVDMHLNMLRGAISAYGGSVEVVEVGNGKAKLNFTGPKPIGYGMLAAIKDKFHDLKEVVLIDPENGLPIEF